ncbi:hypothetical protein F5B21DRAFT_13817 [Xylaria acuta]|nr:hypothetical protein F5B21DRAFT_13817 [Xylaria acuta]
MILLLLTSSILYLSTCCGRDQVVPRLNHHMFRERAVKCYIGKTIDCHQCERGVIRARPSFKALPHSYIYPAPRLPTAQISPDHCQGTVKSASSTIRLMLCFRMQVRPYMYIS